MSAVISSDVNPPPPIQTPATAALGIKTNWMRLAMAL